MKQVAKLLLYVAITFSFLFLTNNKIVGPFCVRHIFATGLLIYYFFNNKYKRIDKIEKHYFVFLIIYLVTSVMNGEIFRTYFVTNFLSFYLSAIALILAIPTLVKEKEDFRLFLGALCITFILNSALTLAQFLNYSWAWELGQLANSGLSREMENNSFLFETNVGFLGRTITAGFTGFVVTNGYFTASYLPASLAAVQNAKSRIILVAALFILCVITCFVNQQRSAFALVGLFVVFYVVYYQKTKWKPVILFFSIVFVLFYGSVFLTADFGRLLDFGDSTRDSIYANFFDFATSIDGVFGGYSSYVEQYGIMQHNSILGSMVLGGYAGFIMFVYLFFESIVALLKRIKYVNWRDKYSIQVGLLSCGCLMYLAYSLTHASGLHNDGIMFFLMYSLIISYDAINEKNTSIY